MSRPVLDSITKLDVPAATLTPPSIFALDSEAAPPVNPYARTFKGVEIDVYRVLRLYGITSPAVQHAVKKLLRFGAGEHKTRAEDIAEAIQSLQRWQEMEAEDAAS